MANVRRLTREGLGRLVRVEVHRLKEAEDANAGADTVLARIIDHLDEAGADISLLAEDESMEEGDIDKALELQGQIEDISAEFSAFMVGREHRRSPGR